MALLHTASDGGTEELQKIDSVMAEDSPLQYTMKVRRGKKGSKADHRRSSGYDQLIEYMPVTQSQTAKSFLDQIEETEDPADIRELLMMLAQLIDQSTLTLYDNQSSAVDIDLKAYRAFLKRLLAQIGQTRMMKERELVWSTTIQPASDKVRTALWRHEIKLKEKTRKSSLMAKTRKSSTLEG